MKRLQLYKDLNGDTLSRHGKNCISLAKSVAGISSLDELSQITADQVIYACASKGRSGDVISRFRWLFQLIKHPEASKLNLMTARERRKHVSIDVLKGNDSGSQWIRDLLDNFAAWKRIVRPCSEKHMGVHKSRITRVLLAANVGTVPDILSITTPQWIELISSVVKRQITEKPQSLIKQKRQTRAKNVEQHAVGKQLSFHYTESIRFLLDFLNSPLTKQVLGQAVFSLVCQETGATDILEDQHPDVITAEEMNNALDACTNERERLIIILLSRLGMRIGAIRNLRLTGVIDNIEQLHRDTKQPWHVRTRIRSLDKFQKVNEWDLSSCLIVREALENYLNSYWRPRFECWGAHGDQKKLICTWLFPARSTNQKITLETMPTEENGIVLFQIPDRPCDSDTLRVMVKDILKRIGISGPRAHPHAFRKGLITELIRCGNPIKTVSLWVHHHSTAVTESSYDMRSFQELVGTMKFPAEWGQEGSVADSSVNSNALNLMEMLKDETELREQMEDRLAAAEEELALIRGILPESILMDIKEKMKSRESNSGSACAIDTPQ